MSGVLGAPQGGMEFGGDGTFGNLGGANAVGVWVGDYTMQPENGGLGVFAHEYAHDLGLPDQYDTAGGENSTGFWTIMSSGSYLGDGTTDLGSRPGDFNAWEKFQLGWLNYEVAFAGKKSEHKLGPAETNTKQAQGLFVVLPDKKVTQDIADPYAGSYFYYSGSGDNLDNSMTRSVTLPAGTVSLAAQVNYQIELDWDYAYLTVNGAPVATNRSTGTNPNGQNFGYGITGSSGGWVALTADLSAYAGQTVALGFRYWTDGAVVETGFMVDELMVTGQATDGAESDAGWTYAGFNTTDGSEDASLLQRLRRRVPAVPRLRHRPEDGTLQLRLPQHDAGLGRAFPVSGRHAGVVLGHLVHRQQHEPASRWRPHPAGRRASRRRSFARTRSNGALAYRRTTRRSALARPMPSRCTSTASLRASRACPACRRSTT